MKIRFASDLHTEFWPRHNPQKCLNMLKKRVIPTAISVTEENGVIDPDRSTVLSLAGDVMAGYNKKETEDYFRALAHRFLAVVYVTGNHEGYSDSYPDYRKDLKEALAPFDNVHLLDRDVVIINGQRFVGCTLWTDFARNNETLKVAARVGFNDYKQTKNFDPEDAYGEHLDSIMFLQDEIRPGDFVITHHAPSVKSISPRFKDDYMNPLYYSDLDELIADMKPVIWHHGHVHHAFDYEIADTRIICNPHGYHAHESWERIGYKPNLTVEI